MIGSVSLHPLAALRQRDAPTDTAETRYY